MGSLRDQVRDGLRSGEFRQRLLQDSLGWREHGSPHAVGNVVAYAAQADAADELHAVLIDDDFRALRRAMFGTNALRADLQAGLAYFSRGRPDLLRYLTVLFVEQSDVGDEAELAVHRRHCAGFADFLQLDVLPHERLHRGLNRVLRRFFPVPPAHKDPRERWAETRIGSIHLLGYELGDWQCACGERRGQTARYEFSCRCGETAGTGRLDSPAPACPHCTRPAEYVVCGRCRTRVTLDLIWNLRAAGSHPSTLRVPLRLDLLVEDGDGNTRQMAPTLMQLPLLLGLREKNGAVTFDLPDLFWLTALDESDDPALDAPHLLSIADSPRYDGRRDMCDVLEAVLRRTFLGSQGSYQAFHRLVQRLVTTEATGPGRRSAGLSRGFEVRLDRALRGPGDSPDAVRFVDLSYECVVAASPKLRGRMALVNRGVAAPGALSAPFLKNAEVVLRDPATDGVPVLCDRPERFPAAGADGLGQDGLAVPGRTVRPGDVLVAMTARPPQDDLTPEERLLAAIFTEQADPYRDRSVRLGGRLEGCVLAQHVLASRNFPVAGIRRVPGRHVTTGAQLRFGEIARLTTTVAVDQPVEAGDVLVHQDGSAVVVCGTAGGDGPLRAAGRPRSEPEVLVAPGHPWLAGAERATVRLRLRTTGLAGPAVHSRLSGVYALNNAPLAGVAADGFAQFLEPEHFHALLDRGATNLAVELYGPRCDFVAWRAPFAAALRDGQPRLNAVREAIPERTADHPDHVSAQLHEWSALLRVLGVQMVRDGDRLSFRPYSDDAVVAATHGTVSLAEGRNPRTGDALRRGLLCEQVFGPERDWVCRCEKLRGERRAGTVCSECGVDVQSSAVRRTRFGHVALAARVVNPLYVYCPNSLLAEWLGLDAETVRRIVACEAPVVSGGDGLFEVTRDAAAAEGNRCLYGADAVEALLSKRTREGKISSDWSPVIRAQLPVLPPTLRTMVRMHNGRFLVSDLHDLYLSVVRVNVALRRRLDEGDCPDVLRLKLTAELQQSVDRLLVNELVPWPARSSQGRRKLVSVSRSITARLMRGGTAREGFLRRAVDFSATARLVAGETPGGDTALLAHRLAWDLFRPLVVAEIARSEQGADRCAIASRAPHDATVIAAVRALADHALILVTIPEGPVRLLALQFRPSADRALKVHPDLLDLIGWENLGRPVGMFAVLTQEAGAEARTLLPSVLLPTARTTADRAPDGRAGPLGLAGQDFLDAVPRWVAYGDSFPLSEHDSLALGDVDRLLRGSGASGHPATR